MNFWPLPLPMHAHASELIESLFNPAPVILRVFVASIWFGMQAFWGGQATGVCLGAVFTGKQNF